MKKLWMLLLAALLVLSLAACQETPVETTAPPPTEPVVTTAPPPAPEQVYEEARAALDGMAAVTLEITQTVTTTVEEQSFVEETEQVLTYTALDTDKPMAWLTEDVPYEDPESEEEETTRVYSEIYADGILYVELEDAAKFSGSFSLEELFERYVPVVLLDSSLYGKVTMEEEADRTVISFAEPTAGEAWAIPEEAELLEATGSAVIGTDGALQEMCYTATYMYGSAEVTVDIQSKPRAEAQTVTVPEDGDKYVPLQCVDALRIALYSDNMLEKAETASATSRETITTQAAGVVRIKSTIMDMYDVNGLMAKFDTNVRVMDPYNGNQLVHSEELYRDGKYVVTVDDGVPTTQTGVKEDVIRDACQDILTTCLATPEYWQEVTATDMGSTYLLEYTYTEDFGNTIQNMICFTFWEDPGFLNNLASSYENSEVNGYLSVDKYTGLPISSGMYYKGVHTIDGDDYELTMQKDQSVTMPSFGAYKDITEQLQPETQPEAAATPLFYHVTGADGQEMWLLGTIHVGDERTGFLPQEIYDAFAASDALALEIDSEAFEAKLEEDEALQSKVSDAYYYSNGKTAKDILDEETYETAVKLMKAIGSYNENLDYLKISMWENDISNFYLRQGHQLHGEQGVEERLTKLAKEQEKPIREVESSLFQIRMLTGWTDELQILLLQDALAYDAREYWADVSELYELWCAGDEEALRKELSDEPDLSELTEEELAEYNANRHLYDEYNKGMSIDRNEDMLEVAIDYLESDEVVFYAVGLAHLLNETNGLVDALRDAGYTVELVTYYQ